MKEYLKPVIEEEVLEIEDIVANSLTASGQSSSNILDDPDGDNMGGSN